MIRTIPLLFFVCLSFYSVAQECDFETNETDKFTNEKKVVTKPVEVSGKVKIPKVLTIKSVEWQVRAEDNKYFLATIYKTKRGTILMGGGGEKLILLLENDEIVELTLLTQVPSQQVNSLKLELTYQYTISPEKLKKLSSQNVKDVRVEAAVNGVDYSIDEEVATTEIFRCIEQ